MLRRRRLSGVEASRSKDQEILEEKLTIAPDAHRIDDVDLSGDRRLSTTMAGEVSLLYEAVVEQTTPVASPTGSASLLDGAPRARCCRFYCRAGSVLRRVFGRFADREFGQSGDGVDTVMAVLAWITENVDYVHGVSTPETTAGRTFVDRAGVCRDFTHLGITLCRALSIPARAVSAYALELQPPDFHAIFEVYLENAGGSLIRPDSRQSKGSSGSVAAVMPPTSRS